MSTGKDLSVGLTATCEDDSITIHFDKPGSYRIWRKHPDEQTWGAPICERPIGTEFVDQDIAAGQALEYKVQEFNAGAVGYILAGSKIPLVDNRGKLVLIVEARAGSLVKELQTFVSDLVGDGYEVVVKFCVHTDPPEHVKSLIKAEYDADPANVRTVILFGAVPVKLSGLVNYDGHGAIPVAADGFYADMTGDWSNGPGIFPAHLNLTVSRIDFSNLVCYKNKPINPRSELDLLRQYLNRNHAFRTGQWSVTPRGAIRDGFPDRDFAWNGWGNMPQLCRDGIEEISDGQFFATATAKDYLLVHLCGGGQITSMAGTGGSDDFALHNINVPFVMLLGSAFLGRWQLESNFLRSALASGGDEKGCLCAFGAGAPHVFLHRMALGGTIGESFLLSENNFTVYSASGNVEPPPGGYVPMESTGIPPCAGRVHQSLHGDPTLPAFVVQPVTHLIAQQSGTALHLSWDGGSDNAFGYRVYRSASANGPFKLIMETLNPFVVVQDHFPSLIYMVRAVKLVETPSGSFYQASTGVFWTGSQTPPMPPDPTKPMSKATFIKADVTTQGNWIGNYGGDGYYIGATFSKFPSYATIPRPDSDQYEWADPGNDIRAPFTDELSKSRIASVWVAPIGFAVKIKSDALPHRLALYFWDVDRTGRRQRVEILDGATDAVLDSREISNFHEGLWLVYDYAGSVTVRVTKLAGQNAILNALMFSPSTIVAPTPNTTRTLEILSGPTATGPWTSRGTVEVETVSPTEFYKLAIK